MFLFTKFYPFSFLFFLTVKGWTTGNRLPPERQERGTEKVCVRHVQTRVLGRLLDFSLSRNCPVRRRTPAEKEEWISVDKLPATP